MRLIVQRVAETGSTNADLIEAARAGAPAGRVLVAERQHAGRGRRGRTWEAPAGASLLMSILLRPALEVGELHLLTQWVALTAADACEQVAGVRPELKWPNDLLIGSRKLAGILAESVLSGDRAEAVVVGIGLNVDWPDPMPGDLAERATSLSAAARRPVTVDAVLDAMVAGMGRGFDAATVATRYRAELATLGRFVRVDLGDRVIEGMAVDVTPAGHLVVESSDGRHDFAVGDVVHVR